MILPLRREPERLAPTGAVAAPTNDLTVASSQNSVITAGISGSTGALDITDSGSHRCQRRPGDERNRNNHPGCSEFGSGCDHSGWSDQLQWSSDRRQGKCGTVGTGAGGGDVTFGSTLALSSGGNDDLTITAGTGAVTLTGAVEAKRQ